jgi:uncharacterized protein YjbI with pentapeptide repeats
MANDEHVAMLKKSVDTWNECWRLGNFDMRPNLVGADLTEACLNGAYLREADLAGAHLSGTIERYDPQRLCITAVQQVLDHCRGICFGGISFDVCKARPPKAAKDEMDIRIK